MEKAKKPLPRKKDEQQWLSEACVYGVLHIEVAPAAPLEELGGSQKLVCMEFYTQAFFIDRTYAKIAQKLNLSNRQDPKNAKNS